MSKKSKKNNKSKRNNKPKPRNKPNRTKQPQKQRNKNVVRGKGAYSFGAAADWPALGLKGWVRGSGPYQYVGRTASQAPRIYHEGDDVIVCFDEYLGDLLSSTSFQNNVFPINIGNSTTFPWLSVLARQFEEYKFDALLFSFRSMSADALNSTNTALGSVIMAAEYNVLNTDFTSKIQMENTMWACSTRPSESISFPIECDSKVNPLGVLYIQNGQQSVTSADLRFYQLASMQIATQGMQAAGVNIGEIWTSYKVRLKKPYLNPANIPTLAFFKATGFGNPMTMLLQSATISYNSLGITYTSVAGSTTIVFPPNTVGKFAISYIIKGGTASVALPNTAATYAGSVSAYNILPTSIAFISNANPDAGVNYFITNYVILTNSNSPSTVIWTTSGGNYPTGVSNWILVINPLPTDFN